MALTKQDLQAIQGVVKKETDDLAQLMVKTMASKEDLGSLRSDMNTKFDEVHAEFRKVNNRLDSVDTYVVQQRNLVRILRDKKVLTTVEAKELGVV